MLNYVNGLEIEIIYIVIYELKNYKLPYVQCLFAEFCPNVLSWLVYHLISHECVCQQFQQGIPNHPK